MVGLMAVAYLHDQPNRRVPLRLDPLTDEEQRSGYGVRHCPRCHLSIEVPSSSPRPPLPWAPVPEALAPVLSGRETQLFEVLYGAVGTWVRHNVTREALWGRDQRFQDPHNLKVIAARLRRKLRPYGWRLEIRIGGHLAPPYGAYRLWGPV